MTTTRIARLKLLLGAVLLLTLAVQPCAFTMHTLARSPLQTRQKMERFAAVVEQEAIWPDALPVDVEKTGSVHLLESIDDNAVPAKSNSRLHWLLLLVALLESNLFQTSTVPGAESVALSTVSATLLRSHRGFRLVSVQQVVAWSLLTWQIVSNLGRLMNWAQVAGSAFSLWYMSCLTAFPIFTKALTSGAIGFLGDSGAQLLEERIRCRKEGARFQFRSRFDRRRSIAKVADGIFVTGPLLHFSYNFLEMLIPVSGAATGLAASLAAITQVMIDDFFLDAIFVGIMYVTTGLGEGYKMQHIVKHFRKDYVGAVRTSWSTSVLLMPLEFVLFRFFPLSVRVLGMNFLDIVWEGVVSFLVHKRRKSQNLELEVQEMQNMLTIEAAAVPAQKK